MLTEASFPNPFKKYSLTSELGLGRGMVEALLQRPDVTIIAGVRDTSSPTSQSLTSLASGPNSKLILTPIEVSSQESVKSGIASLSTHGITHIDILISNAGISNYYGPATVTPLSQVREHFEVNAIGTLSLFQEAWPLLKESKKEGGPVFLTISSGIGSIGDMAKMPLESTAYGMSKAAVNYAVRKIHFENEGLVAFVISPGYVLPFKFVVLEFAIGDQRG